MARRKGLTPQGAVGTFLPMGVGFGMAGAAIGLSAAGAAQARAAGQPGTAALMDVASMGVGVHALDVAFGKRRRL